VFLQKIVVGKQTPCDGVLNGHHDVIGLLLFQRITGCLEGIAFNGLNVVAKELESSFLVEGSFGSLYGYSFSVHFFSSKKKSRILTETFYTFFHFYICISIPAFTAKVKETKIPICCRLLHCISNVQKNFKFPRGIA